MVDTNKYVVRGLDRRATTVSDTPARLARGTRRDMNVRDISRSLGRAPVSCLQPPAPGGAVVEHQLGIMWMVDLRVEMFARNLAVAGALETARRLGEAFPRDAMQPREEF